VIGLSLGPAGASEAARPTLPVLLWILVLFAAAAGLPRAFVHEEETRTATALRLAARPSSVFAGKALYNLTLVLALEALVTPLFLAMLQLPVERPGELAATLAAGGYGLAVGSTLVAAMVAQARSRGPLFAVLAFPVLLPLLRLAVVATLGAVLAVPTGGALLQTVLYDAVLTVAGLMLFPLVWNP
jgi:heme exporter protein B